MFDKIKLALPIAILLGACTFGCSSRNEAPQQSSQDGLSEIAPPVDETASEAATKVDEEPGELPEPATDELPEEAPSPQPPPPRKPEDFLAGRAGDIQFLRVFSDGFERLIPRSRTLAYHLAGALLSGRDILYDQLNEYSLEMRKLFESLVEYGADTALKTNSDIASFLTQLWINSCHYDATTRLKIVPAFSYEDLCAATAAANALGAEMTPSDDESIEQTLARLKRAIFDPDFQPLLAGARPQRGEDPLAFSNLNLYSGVSLRQVARFSEEYPLNSRLVQVEGKLVENVFRAGDKLRKIPRGRHFGNLNRVLRHLEDAMVAAGRETRQALAELSESLRTGDIQSYQRACLGLSGLEDDIVFSFGFSDLTLDPRRTKGLLEGFVAVRDPSLSARIQSLLNGREKILDSLDWPEEWKNRSAQSPRVVAAELLAGIGRQGPLARETAAVCGEAFENSMPPAGVVFSNVIEARCCSLWVKMAELWPAAVVVDKDADCRELAFTREVLRSLVAASLGSRSARFHRRLWPHDLVLTQLQYEAIGLWLVEHPLLAELGWLPNRQHRQQLLRMALMELLLEQALWAKQPLLASEPLARRILLRYLLENAKLLEVKFSASEPQLLMAPAEKWQEALAKLARRTQRIIYIEDRLAAQRLVEKYSSPPEGPWVEALARSAQQGGIPRRQVLVMPRLKALRSEGRIVDAATAHDDNFERQMMRYGKY